MTTVLITGISGFVGAHLAATLRSAGYVVKGTTLSQSGPDSYRCDLATGEGLEEAVLDAQPDVIFHCAAISTVVHANATDYYAANVIGTKHLLAAARKLGRRTRFIFLSTAGVYGNHPVEFLTETLTPRPVHDYGMSKLCAEFWVSSAAEFADVTIVRPFNVLGAGQKSFFIGPKLALAFARRDRQIRLGNIDVYRDYVDIGAFSKSLVDFVDCSASYGEIVNFCSGTPTSLRELIEVYQKLAGYEIEVVQAQEFMRSNEVWRLLGAREKFDRLAPTPLEIVPLEVTLKRMLDFYARAE